MDWWVTTPWQWPYMITTKPYYNNYNNYDQNGLPPADPPEDQGLFYLWSPLCIFSVVLACVVGLAIIIMLAIFIYNYCTYGMCCCPGAACNGSQSCDMCCMGAQKEQPTQIIRKRRISHVGDDNCSQCSRGSVRSRRSSDGQIVVMSRPNADRKVVRISDMPTVHPVRARQSGPELSQIYLVEQEPPQMMVQQPSAIRPITMDAPVANCPRPSSGFPGGELRVIIGNAEQLPSRSNNIVYSMNQTPSVSCQISRTQPEYRLTSVDHGMNGSGGFGSTARGFNTYDQDNNSCFSDGQRSAVIDIGQRNSFYPSLSQYDN